MTKVLIVDDEKDIGDFFQYFLKKFDLETTVALDLTTARKCLNDKFDLIILDIKLPDGNGIDFLDEINEISPETKVIIITGVSTIRTAVEAIKKGAYDYIEKPFEDLDDLENVIKKALESNTIDTEDSVKSKQLRDELGFVVGESSKMSQILSIVEKVAGKKITILITGETGTGKEVLARYIHGLSERAYNPFVPVNCGAFSETLLESQLFGHEKGSFTDANATKKGVFEIANNGTLFLDEIGEASKNVQVKLLRILDTGKFSRIGSEKSISTDCRIIAATNVDLEKAVEIGSFRKDLYYRLNVVNLEIPPLRERIEDIPLLARHIAENKYNKKINFSSKTIQKLKAYHWPGNIRELANLISRGVALSSEEDVIKEEHLLISGSHNNIQNNYNNHNNEDLTQRNQKSGKSESESDGTGSTLDPIEELEEILYKWFKNYYLGSYNDNKNESLDLNVLEEEIKNAEKNFIKRVLHDTLKETVGDRKEACRKLGISSRKFRYLLKEKD